VPSACPPLTAAPLHASALEEVQTFVVVAQSGNFSAAASRLGKDGSTVSRRIGALEARLGLRLFERTTRHVALTEPGAAYLARMTAVLDEIADADAQMSSHRNVPQGLLRVTMPRSYGRLCVAPLLPAFLARHPGVRVEAHYADHFVDLVGEGFDVAIRLGQLRDSTLVARRLATFGRRLVASSAYLRRHGTPRRPQELQRHQCLGFAGHERGSAWVLRKAEQRVDVPIAAALVADDAETLVAAAAEDAGIAIATDWLLEKHPARKRLVPVLRDWAVGDDSAVHAVTPAARFLPAKTTVFIDMVTQHLRR